MSGMVRASGRYVYNTHCLAKLPSAGKLHLTDALEKDQIICSCNFGVFYECQTRAADVQRTPLPVSDAEPAHFIVSSGSRLNKAIKPVCHS